MVHQTYSAAPQPDHEVVFILYPAASKSLHALTRNPKVPGLEVIGAISVIVSIIDASIKVYDGAQKDVKLPDTFHVGGGRRLSFLRDTLETCKSHLQPIQDSLSTDVYKALEKTLEGCDERAGNLR
ncbi:hypothetical protein AYO21_03694 [Fonsecaea monophora]|uniref:NACHT-NTPase and P-loop NTPases N-terminal domain-containing protein n=1 Tax=Fonsecaea monophora TaxID=254056 RepID=A0A177FFF7_9EURO|nr:hypothetical protein AYO21_03694 [Fonsecaea monophora]OAG41959.1 hypothetical protein AYO21_03694 [Fonsecaea monophora]